MSETPIIAAATVPAPIHRRSRRARGGLAGSPAGECISSDEAAESSAAGAGFADDGTISRRAALASNAVVSGEGVISSSR
jgi:hypothetical protein